MDESSGLDEIVLECEGHGLGAATDLELGEDVAHMELDRGAADDDLFGDGCVVHALNHERQHFAFAFSEILARLRAAGLRPTRQRLALGKLLFAGGNRHVTAEMLHEEAVGSKIQVSLATVYNTLNQFTDAGLLREVVVEAGRAYFDTNTNNHHHFFHVDSGELKDLSDQSVHLAKLPDLPEGTALDRVDVVIRVRNNIEN